MEITSVRPREDGRDDPGSVLVEHRTDVHTLPTTVTSFPGSVEDGFTGPRLRLPGITSDIGFTTQ